GERSTLPARERNIDQTLAFGRLLAVSRSTAPLTPLRRASFGSHTKPLMNIFSLRTPLGWAPRAPLHGCRVRPDVLALALPAPAPGPAPRRARLPFRNWWAGFPEPRRRWVDLWRSGRWSWQMAGGACCLPAARVNDRLPFREDL